MAGGAPQADARPAGSGVGIVAGAEVLRVVDRAYIRLAVGAVVVFSALLLVRDSRLPGADTR